MHTLKEQDCAGEAAKRAVIVDMASVPPEVKAVALYKRALVPAEHGDQEKAGRDLKEVLAMRELAEVGLYSGQPRFAVEVWEAEGGACQAGP